MSAEPARLHSLSVFKLFVLALAAVTSCGDGATDIERVPADTALFAIAIEPDTAFLHAGDSARLEVHFLNAEGDTLPDRQVAWESHDTAIARVDQTGRVTAIRVGVAAITAGGERQWGTAWAAVVLERPFTEVAAGHSHACALDQAGELYCWGSQVDGYWPTLIGGELIYTGLLDGYCGVAVEGSTYCLDDGDMKPEDFGGHDFVALSSGIPRCGLTAAGRAYCWGENEWGEVGDGTTESRPDPVAVDGDLIFAQLTAGSAHTCGVTTARDAYCWGWNYEGELGDGTPFPGSYVNPVPLAVVGGHEFVSIAAGTAHTCALNTDGTAYCWGGNSVGSLGDGTTERSSSPVPVAGGLALTRLVARNSQTCGLTSAGRAYCWGWNAYGQLGDGTNTSRHEPVPVTGDLEFEALSAGGQFTCGITVDCLVYCWGWNRAGQLGAPGLETCLASSGTTSCSKRPLAVWGQP